jgi:type IV secretion system protein VirB9
MTSKIAVWLLSVGLLSGVGCSSQKAMVVVPPPLTLDTPPVVEEPPPAPRAPVDEISTLLASEAPSPRGKFELGRLIKRARVEPDPDAIRQGMVIYRYEPGKIFHILTAPGFTTTLVFPLGEQVLRVSGAEARRVETDALGQEREVALWVVESGTSGQGETARDYVVIQPREPKQHTNLVIATTRYVYVVEVSSTPTTYLPLVAFWSEPPVVAEQPSGTSLIAGRGRLGVGYEVRAIAGAIPPWVPAHVWDTGQHTIIRFPAAMTTSEAPVLFVQTPEGTRQLVNYRQVGSYYVADRLAEVWELKLGSQAQSQVEIHRTAAYRYVMCPGDEACPVSPAVALAGSAR